MNSLLLVALLLFTYTIKNSIAEERKVNAVELQENVQRIAGNFMARIGQALSDNEKRFSDQELKAIQQQYLKYASTTIDIATGPVPIVNLLDLMVFFTLERRALEEYWIPKVFGKKGRDVLSAIQSSEAETWELAGEISTKEQQKNLRKLISQWVGSNPGLYNVAGVRLIDFSRWVGKAHDESAKKVKGFLSSIKGASTSVNAATLLSQRAMFLLQRLPFLLRAQTRLGARDITEDTMKSLKRLNKATKVIHEFDPLVGDLSGLVMQTRETVKELETFIKIFRKNFPDDPNSSMYDSLQTTERILDKGTSILAQIDALGAQNTDAFLHKFKTVFEYVVGLSFLALLGLIVAWWTGHYIVKKRLLPPS